MLDVTDVHLICLTEMLLNIQIVTEITAWELLLRSLDDSGSVKPIERPADL